jgi:microcompartment protein CcmK/EutM
LGTSTASPKDLADNDLSTALPAETRVLGLANATGDQALAVDMQPPTVLYFSTSAVPDVIYSAGDVITFTALMSETMTAGKRMTLTLNNGALVTLTSTAGSAELTGSMTVNNGTGLVDVSSLKIVNYQATSSYVPTDLAGNLMVSSLVTLAENSPTNLPTGIKVSSTTLAINIVSITATDDVGSTFGPLTNSAATLTDDDRVSVSGTFTGTWSINYSMMVYNQQADGTYVFIGKAGSVSDTTKTWSFDLPAGASMPDGDYKLFARVETSTGAYSDWSTVSTQFKIETEPHHATTLVASDNVGAMQGSVVDGSSIDDRVLYLKGHVTNFAAGGKVRIFDNEQTVAELSVGYGVTLAGDWDWTQLTQSTSGRHTLVVKYVNADGKESAADSVATLNYTIGTNDPTFDALTSTAHALTVESQQVLNLQDFLLPSGKYINELTVKADATVKLNLATVLLSDLVGDWHQMLIKGDASTGVVNVNGGNWTQESSSVTLNSQIYDSYIDTVNKARVLIDADLTRNMVL